ncbi:hypothetical protein POV27_00640 [Aureisphaera galaxeae]|uniref:hypothetical protein n=1 Tax=Aureisphaera galaxeae TaxID=1538023 RepID=UPI00235036D2|nr:hypothetical protein [Aureisphaera galaxeae]MDC8002543.1 hypothetical protein [Aureisphaera galaxeae]
MLLIFVVFLALPGKAQKVIQRSLDAEGIKKLEITSDQVFLIKLEAKDTETIEIKTLVEGENYENVVLSVEEKEGVLRVKTGYTPYFEGANDKLAAHKVISIEMTLIIPENLSVFVSSFIASVQATGFFENLYTGLNNGNCTLQDFLGNAQLNSRNGFIHVTAEAGVMGTAHSQRGKVNNSLPKTGWYEVTAQSVNGDVILKPSQ